MKIIRFRNGDTHHLAAVTDEDKVYVLSQQDFMEIVQTAEQKGIGPLNVVEEEIADRTALDAKMEELDLLVPIDAPEVWAAGVTYQKSREARNYEATGGKLDTTTFYDKVYVAERPEIFLKSTNVRTRGPNQDLFLRSDSNWQIPEAELGLVINKRGNILGYIAGNDLSSRDIEGENPLYLPQAKVWKNSCSIGPAIRLAETVADPYNIEIICRIFRHDEKVFEGSANTNQLNRKFDELISFLLRDNEIFDGTVLLTGTSIVPPNEFTLADGDRIEIEIEGIGILNNSVRSQLN